MSEFVSVEVKSLARRLAVLERARLAAKAPQLSASSIEDGAIDENDADGNLVSSIGKQVDGTHGVVVLAGPNPPAPTAPGVTPVQGGLIGRFNGKFAAGALSPMDFSHVSLHVTLDLAQAGSLLPGTLKATMAGELGDEFLVGFLPAELHYVWLVAWSKAGKPSVPSPVVEGTPLLSVTAEQLDAADQRLVDARVELEAADAALTAALAGSDADIAAAQVRLDTAEADIVTAFGEIDTVSVTATQAAQDASGAQSTADSASTAASTAQAAADQAKADAFAAAGLAGSKGEIIYQLSAPTGTRASTANLWIRTTDNKLHTYNGTAWTARTDKAATDAAAAALAAQGTANTAVGKADTAQDRADAAHTLAGTAEDNAQLAITSANGKNKRLKGYTPPSGVGGTVGDSYQEFADTTDTVVVGRWGWDGDSWNSEKLSHENFDSVDVGALTVIGQSTLADVVAQQIAADSGKFMNIDVEQLNVTGTGTFKTAVMDEAFAEMFSTRKLAAGNVLVGSDRNLIPNGLGELGSNAGWDSSLTFDTVDTPPGVAGVFRSAPASGSVTSYTSFSVEPNTEYLFEIWLKADKPDSRLYVQLIDQDSVSGTSNSNLPGEPGMASGSYSFANGVVPTTWTKYYAIATTNPEVNKLSAIKLFFNHGNGTERTATVSFAMSMKSRVDGNLVALGSITAPHIVASEELTGKIVRGDMFFGKAFEGGTFTGALYQTLAAANRGIKLNAGGNNSLELFDPTGVRTFHADGNTGSVGVTGSYQSLVGNNGVRVIVGAEAVTDFFDTSVMLPGIRFDIGDGSRLGAAQIMTHPTEPGIRIVSGSSVQAIGGALSLDEAQFSLDDGMSSISTYNQEFMLLEYSNPGLGHSTIRLDGFGIALESEKPITLDGTGIVLNPGTGNSVDIANGAVHAPVPLDFVGTGGATINGGGGNVSINNGDGSYVEAGRDGTGTFVKAPAIDSRTTTQASNVVISFGILMRSTSAARYKIDPQPMNLPDSLLAVPVEDWWDREEVERHTLLTNGPHPLTEEQATELEHLAIKRVPGSIAEKVAAAGGDAFVIYKDGQVDGLAYDRYALARTEVLKRQLDTAVARIEALEAV